MGQLRAQQFDVEHESFRKTLPCHHQYMGFIDMANRKYRYEFLEFAKAKHKAELINWLSHGLSERYSPSWKKKSPNVDDSLVAWLPKLLQSLGAAYNMTHWWALAHNSQHFAYLKISEDAIVPVRSVHFRWCAGAYFSTGGRLVKQAAVNGSKGTKEIILIGQTWPIRLDITASGICQGCWKNFLMWKYWMDTFAFAFLRFPWNIWMYEWAKKYLQVSRHACLATYTDNMWEYAERNHQAKNHWSCQYNSQPGPGMHFVLKHCLRYPGTEKDFEEMKEWWAQPFRQTWYFNYSHEKHTCLFANDDIPRCERITCGEVWLFNRYSLWNQSAENRNTYKFCLT